MAGHVASQQAILTAVIRILRHVMLVAFCQYLEASRLRDINHATTGLTEGSVGACFHLLLALAASQGYGC